MTREQIIAGLLKQIDALRVKILAMGGYDWTTQQGAIKAVRTICDEMGLTKDEKDIICACIWQESNFYNYLPSGKPTTNQNKNKAGKVTSTDWGICQVNDYWNIGPKKKWASVKQVLDNPEKVVRWMITCYKQGNLKLWSSYKFGAYKQHLPRFQKML